MKAKLRATEKKQEDLVTAARVKIGPDEAKREKHTTENGKISLITGADFTTSGLGEF